MLIGCWCGWDAKSRRSGTLAMAAISSLLQRFGGFTTPVRQLVENLPAWLSALRLALGNLVRPRRISLLADIKVEWITFNSIQRTLERGLKPLNDMLARAEIENAIGSAVLISDALQ